MKKNIISKIFFAFLCIISIVGCEDLDEGTKGAIVSEGYYVDDKSMESGLTGIYGCLLHAVFQLDPMAHYTGADDLSTYNGGNKWVFREGDTFALTGGNTRTKTVWTEYYKTINACNDYIKNAHPSSFSEEETNAYQADAYFIRGMLYFRLATTFGDVPMPLTPDLDYEMFKTDKEAVVMQAVSDLEFAAEWASNIRDTEPVKANGRVTKTAARAFLAKTYMQLTGYPFNKTEYWANVKSLTNEIIGEGVYGLLDNFEHNFGEPWENNVECIWAHQFDFQAWPLLTSCRWYGEFWRDWMDMYVEWNFYNNAPEGYRKSFSFSTTSKNAVTYDHPVVTKLLYGTDASKEGYESTFDTSNDMPVMRYAEVLLMAAEAEVRVGDKSKGVEYLNKVRRRAYAGGATTTEEVDALTPGYWNTATPEIDVNVSDFASDEEMAWAVCMERAWEFVAEPGGNRWLDLIRLQKVGEVNQNRDPRELELIGDPSDTKNWWTPIPNSEIELNPNLGE